MVGGDFDDGGLVPLILQTTRRTLYKHGIVRRVMYHIRTRRPILYLPLKQDPVADQPAGMFRVRLSVNIWKQSETESPPAQIAGQRRGEPVNRNSIIFPQRVERFAQPLVKLVVVDGGPARLTHVCIDMDMRPLRRMSWILRCILNLNLTHLIQTFFQKVFIWIEFAIFTRWTRDINWWGDTERVVLRYENNVMSKIRTHDLPHSRHLHMSGRELKVLSKSEFVRVWNS